MRSMLEAIMAQGRAAGVTQRALAQVAPDGRTVRFAHEDRDMLAFSTCNYLALDHDPRTVEAVVDATRRYGVLYSASRCFATSPLYTEADARLEQLFGRPVVLAGSTTLAHSAALPILLDPADVVLFDQQVHHSVQTALAALGPRGPERRSLPHNDMDALEQAVIAAIAAGARRVWYCADGIYSMFGDRLPVAALAALMRRYEPLHAYLDDAHGMSWCGARGSGALLHQGLPDDRLVLATSLSKGFCAAGGVLAVPDRLTKERIENLGPALMFGIQLPPPMLGAVCANAAIHLSDELPSLQATVDDRLQLARRLLRDAPSLAARVPHVDEPPTPISYIALGDIPEALAATRRLLARGFLVNPVSYPAVPRGMAGVRFTVTRAHTADDVRALVAAISEVAAEVLPARRAA